MTLIKEHLLSLSRGPQARDETAAFFDKSLP